MDAERFLNGRLLRGKKGWYFVLLEVRHVPKPSKVFIEIGLILELKEGRS